VVSASALEDVLPLSPMQEGLLFHALQEEQDVDVYHGQLRLHLRGPLDADRLRESADGLLRRHQVLRAGFRLRRSGTPMQVVHRHAEVPVRELDLSRAVDPDAELAAAAAADRLARFDLARPPLLRLTVARLGGDRSCLVLTNHHILLDGWSVSVLVEELFALYAGSGPLPRATPYREHLAWLARQDTAAAERAWRAALDGCAPALVAPGRADAAARLPQRVPLRLPDGFGAALAAATRAEGLTANTVVQGAWGLLVGQLLGRRDAVFGTLVSGRPPQLSGVERMVGLFINTIPVRVRALPGAPARRVLAELQEEQAALTPHHHLQLGRLQRDAAGGELFDTFLVFENYPGSSAAAALPAGLSLERTAGDDAAHYPLRLVASLVGDRFEAELEYRDDLFDTAAATGLAERTSGLLQALVAGPERPVEELAPPEPGGVPLRPGPGSAAAPHPGHRPDGPELEILCGLTADVLGVPAVRAEDDFFALGGQSLSAVVLLSRVRAALGVALPVRAVFEAPTPRDLAARLTTGQRAPQPPGRREHPDRVPLSSAQQRLWFLDRHAGASDTLPLVLRLSGALDPEALEAALRDVVERHEPLRTVFAEHDGEPHQVVLDPREAPPDLPLQRVDGAGLADAITRASRHRFDLAAEPPLLARLFALDEREHVLLLVVHHIATDGWSSGPLLRDLGTAYGARSAGRRPGWARLPVRYTDYALWQREQLAEADDPDSRVARGLGWWRTALAGLPDRIELPLGDPTGTGAERDGGTVPVELPAPVHAELVALARRRGATVFMAVQAALAALLTRLGSGEDVPIGTVVSGRGETVLEELVGFFANPLVLRTDTSGDPPFEQLLDRVRDADLGAYAHQDLPFERVVEAVNPVRSTDGHPLFQVLLAFQELVVEPLALPGLTVTGEGLPTGAARLELSFALAARTTPDGEPAGIGGVLEYPADRLDRGGALRLAGRLTRFLTAVAARPDTPISRVGILDEAERRTLLEDWNGPVRQVPQRSWGDLLADQAERTPEAVAVEAGRTRVSYAELHAAARRLAARLRERGAGPERVVAVALPRSVELVVAVVAVAHAGAAYLPVDPAYPAARITHLLDDARPSIVLSTTAAAAGLPLDGAPLVLLDDGDDGPAPAPLERPVPVHTAHPAYTIYTSGSTGRPRGVQVTHAGLAALALNQRTAFGAGPGSRVLQFVSPSFDVSVDELCMALLSGGCLVVPERPLVGAELADLLRERRITHVHLPAAVLTGLPRTELPDLVTLITGAESCPTDVLDRWAGDRLVVNAYGPTEATVDVTFAVHPPPVDRTGTGRPSIGRPIPDARAYVLDARLQLVPTGAAGELYLAGPGLARGYAHAPAETAARFVADPYAVVPGTRMYRTGDLARRRPDGELEFLGRTDRQVKVRGFRIELGEVEAVLRSRPEVAGAAVVVREDRPGDRRIVGYPVPAGDPLDPVALRAAIAAELPQHAVPSALVPVPSLPLTPNGKLDTAALPVPARALARSGRAPSSPREQVLCDLFAEVVGAPFGPEDDFFDAGGHSLLAARLTTRIRAVLGTDASAGALFRAPTPAGLLRLLDDGAPGGGDALDLLLPLRAGGGRAPLFCLHPIAGTSWRYASLLRGLGPEHPVHGLQARGLRHGDPLPGSVAELVGDYADAIREVQPTGPYHLLGWSMGGNLAHALATRMQDQGDRIGLLALLDAYPIEERRRAVVDPGEILRQVHDGYAEAYDPPGRRPSAPDDPERLRAAVVDYLGRGTSELRLFDAAQRGRVLDVMVNTVRLVAPHEPDRFDGDLLLVVAGGSRQAWATPQSWQPHVTGAVEATELPFPHAELLDPPSAVRLGALLADRIGPAPEGAA
jgi:nonribosomal peptide synthetase DhbF